MRIDLTIAMIIFAAGWRVVGAEATPPSAQPATPPSTQPAKELNLDLGNNLSLKLVLIPAGKFMMGSPAAEKGRTSDEGPQREVTISKPFYMAIYPVTQEQFDQVLWKNRSNFKGPQNPVEVASWNDAMKFCKKLSETTGQQVRLPTEAQWEYACRAGTTTRFSSGDDDKDLNDYAWYAANSEATTHPVGQKKPNGWGLYDMHGNVWQWCSDYYGKSYADLTNVDPQGRVSGTPRVLRGGSWHDEPGHCRSAYRDWRDPGHRFIHIGFRVAVDVK